MELFDVYVASSASASAPASGLSVAFPDERAPRGRRSRSRCGFGCPHVAVTVSCAGRQR